MATTTKTRKPRKQAKTKRTKKAATPEQGPKAKAFIAQYPHVKRVVKTGKNDKPVRVVIGCTAQYEGCEDERECATQDAFQVVRCHSCQREYLKRRRRKGFKAA